MTPPDANQAGVSQAPDPRTLGSKSRRIRALGALLAAVGLLGCLILIALRLTYPFELEWLEGITLFSIERLLEGRPLYVQPDFTWSPLPYGPLYFQGASLLAGVGIEGFLAPRLLSLIATLGLFVLLGVLGSGVDRKGIPCGVQGLVAAGFLALAYPFCGAWLDLARPDALALFFLLAAFWNHQRSRARSGWFPGTLTVLLALAAYHTKQTTLLPLLGFLVADFQRSKIPLIGFVVGLPVSLVLASAWTSGWYEFHTLELLWGHGLYWPGIWEFVQRDLIFSAPIWILALLGLRGCNRAQVGLFVGGLAASCLGRLHPGGYDNALLPLVICAAPLASEGWSRRPALGNLMLAVLFGLGLWTTADLVPSAQDQLAGEALVQRIGALEGEVFSPAHGSLLARAGKQHQLHLMSWMDLSASDAGLELARDLVDQLEERLSRGQLRHAVVGAPRDLAEAEFVALLRRHLPDLERLLPESGPGAMVPVSGAQRRPELLLSAPARGN